MAEESLKKKTFQGVAWTFVDKFGNTLVGLIIGIVLARLLTPADFGLLAMIDVFLGIAGAFVECGFSQALIRKPDLQEKDLYTAFWWQLCVSVVMYILLFIAAPYIADFYNQPILKDIVRVTSFPMVLSCLNTFPKIHFSRELKFNQTARISIIHNIITGFIGIVAAYNGCGPWSMVIQGLFSAPILAYLNYRYCPWKIRFVFSKESFRYLFGFGNKLLADGLISVLYNNIVPVMLGKFYSPKDLGLFNKAQGCNGYFSVMLTTGIVQQVTYPALSKIQTDTDRLRSAYRRIIKTTMIVSCAGSTAIAAMSEPLIFTLYGAQWLPCTEYLQIICYSGMLFPLEAINLNIIKVKGRSDLYLLIGIYKRLVGIVPIIIGIFYGIKIMLCLQVVTTYICFYLNARYSAGLIQYSWVQQFKDVLPSILSSIVIGGVAWTITLLPLPYIAMIPLQLIVLFALTCTFYEYAHSAEYYELKEIARKGFSVFKSRLISYRNK